MFCRNCGNQISENDTFCVNCGTPVKPPMQAPAAQPVYQPPVQAPSQAPPVYSQPSSAELQDRGIYGRFGGLFIFGVLIITLFAIGAVSSEYFLVPVNMTNIFRQLLIMLPAAFAVGLSIKAKGIDLSFPAMASLTMGIIMSSGNLGTGIVISVFACIAIGVINALGIHFLKLPGILVTIITYMLVINGTSFLLRSGEMFPVKAAPVMMYVAVALAVIVAVAFAFVSSIGKDHRNKFWSMLLVYAGSAILAVLYTLALTFRIQAATYIAPGSLLNNIILIGLFLSITRFFKSKALALVFAIIPCIMLSLLNNILNLMSVNAYIQQTVILSIVLIMIFLVFYRGRATLEGQRLDRIYRGKSWIALIPLLLLLLKVVFMTIMLMAQEGRPSMLYYTFTGITFDVILFLIAIGLSVVYGLIKPKGSMTV